MDRNAIYALCAWLVACSAFAGYSTRWPLSSTSIPSAQDFIDLNGALQERVFAAYATNTMTAYTNMFRLNTNYPSYCFVTSAMWAVTSYLENRFVDRSVLTTWFDTNSSIPYCTIERTWAKYDYPKWGYNLQSTGTGTIYAVMLPMVPMTNKTLLAKTYFAQRELNTTTYARVYQLSCYHPTYWAYRSSCPFDVPEYWLVCPTSECYVSSYIVPSYSYTNPTTRSALQAITLKVSGTAFTNSSWGWLLYTGVTESVDVDWTSTNWIKLANTYRTASITNTVGGYASETNHQQPTVAGNGFEIVTMIEGRPCAMFEYVGPRVGVEIPRISIGYNAWMSATVLNTIKYILDDMTVSIGVFDSVVYTNHTFTHVAATNYGEANIQYDDQYHEDCEGSLTMYYNETFSAFPSYSACDDWPGSDIETRSGSWSSDEGSIQCYYLIPQTLAYTKAGRVTAYYSSTITDDKGDDSISLSGLGVRTGNGGHLRTCYSARHAINAILTNKADNIYQYIRSRSIGIVTQTVGAGLSANFSTNFYYGEGCFAEIQYFIGPLETRRPAVNSIGSYITTNYAPINAHYKFQEPTLITDGSVVYYEHKFWMGSSVDDTTYGMESFTVTFTDDGYNETTTGYTETEYVNVEPETFIITQWDFDY